VEHRSIWPGREALPEDLPGEVTAACFNNSRLCSTQNPALPSTALHKAAVTSTAHAKDSAPMERENADARTWSGGHRPPSWNRRVCPEGRWRSVTATPSPRLGQSPWASEAHVRIGRAGGLPPRIESAEMRRQVEKPIEEAKTPPKVEDLDNPCCIQSAPGPADETELLTSIPVNSPNFRPHPIFAISSDQKPTYNDLCIMTGLKSASFPKACPLGRPRHELPFPCRS
jgi:hypothetical protein